jgi:hypothetical protein
LKYLIVLLVVVSAINAFATIINIPDDYSTIRAGIDASSDGDTVLVQPGIYYENLNFNGHNIVLGSLFLTTGDTSFIAQTIIDGDSSGSVVIFTNNEDSSAVFTGLKIQHGYSNLGGGIYCFNASPTISSNNITNNSSCWGAGIYCENSNSLIINNVISYNLGSG